MSNVVPIYKNDIITVWSVYYKSQEQWVVCVMDILSSYKI